MRNQYSYMVAYENLLRGTGLTEVRDETFVGGNRTASDFKPGNITSFTKIKKEAGDPDREVLHLLNFDGAAHDSWVDKGLAQTAPHIKENQSVRHTCQGTPKRVWAASPDFREGAAVELSLIHI